MVSLRFRDLDLVIYWKKIILMLLIFVNGVEAGVMEGSSRVCLNNVCSQIELFKSDKLTKSPVLVVSIHGDSPFSRPSYHYRFAKRVALESSNVVSVGILRPGYIDDFNRKSDGERGESVGDSYDDKRVLQIANAVESLRTAYNPRAVVLAGHSGGGAIAAKIIALKPGIADTAFIVSCPCNINSWRADRLRTNQFEGFKGDLKISSPIDLVSKIDSATDIYIYAGERDNITLPYLSEQYYQALIKARKKARYFVIDGGHEIFQSEPVFQSLIKAVESHNKVIM